MRFNTKLMIGCLVALGFGTLFVLFVMYLMKRTKTDGVNVVNETKDKYKKFVHDKKDKTGGQKLIHRKAGESEYWARHDMDQGLYA